MVKDPARHQGKTQKKAIRENRKQEAEKEQVEKEESLEEREGVEVEEQQLVKRPLNRRFH